MFRVGDEALVSMAGKGGIVSAKECLCQRFGVDVGAVMGK